MCGEKKGSMDQSESESLGEQGGSRDKSESLREQGNVVYRELANQRGGGGEDVAESRRKLVRARQLYNEALELSTRSAGRASCCRNLGALHFLWAQLELETVPSWKSVASDAWSSCMDHAQLSVGFYLKGKVEGARAGKPREWLASAESSLLQVVSWAAEQSRILALADAPLVRALCHELDCGIANGNVTTAAAPLAHLELAHALLDHAAHKQGKSYASEEAVFQSQEARDRAYQLMESLPPHEAPPVLQTRLSALESMTPYCCGERQGTVVFEEWNGETMKNFIAGRRVR